MSAKRELQKLRDDFRGASIIDILAQPGYWAVFNFRIAAALRRDPALLPLYILYAPIWRLITLITGIEISPKTSIDGGLRFVHYGQVFISAGTTIGKRCLILNNVTIGTNRFDDNSGPTIGDDVKIGAGARVLGQISIGDRCQIGANAVVTRTFAADEVLVGIPARAVSESRTASDQTPGETPS